MRLLDIRLVNYAGIKAGTGLNELYIDLRPCRNNLLLIRGKNGGGKSTLLNAMSPFPDSNDSFIEGLQAIKELTYLLDDMQYHIIFDHTISRGKRNTVRAFIQKINTMGALELNPTGNITQFKEVIENEFGLDPNFMLLSSLSNDSRGIVDNTPTERMKYVMIGMSDINVYNDMNKTLSKRESSYKSIVNSLTAKIDNIGNYEALSSNLMSIDNRLAVIDNRLEELSNKISDLSAMIRVHDSDGSIQESYNTAINDYNSLNEMKNNIQNRIKSIITNNCKYISNDDIELCDDQYKKFSDIVSNLKQNIEDKKKQLDSKILKRDEEIQTLHLKISRLDSIKSKYDFIDLKNNIAKLTNEISKYEDMFNNLGIRNAISITKDEYITGIRVMREIKESIDALKSFTNHNIIDKTITYHILGKSNIGKSILNTKAELDDIELKLSKSYERMRYLEGLLDRLSILDKRPSSCKIDSCEFIKNALEIKSLNPEKEHLELCGITSALEAHKGDLEANLQEYEQIQYVARNIDIINRTIENNRFILEKMPNGHIFLDKNELYNRLINNDLFNDIDIILDKVQYANAFEEYKLCKENLKSLESEYMVYESKNEIITEISNDIERINKSIESMTSEIDETKSYVLENAEKLNKCIDVLNELSAIIPEKRELDNVQSSILVCNEKINSLSDSMKKISVYLNDVNVLENEKTNLIEQRKPLLRDRDSITFSLRQLDEYNRDLEYYNKYYNMARVLKRYSSPSKKSIQQLFISMYMSNTIETTNRLLGNMFGGRLELMKCIIDDNKFAIPAYSHESNMCIDDISSCSTSEKSMASMLLGFALMYQASVTYNIAKLDEIEFGLDSANRVAFPYVLENIRSQLGIEQIIMISHSLEMDKGSFDIIQLQPASDADEECGGNIIFKL